MAARRAMLPSHVISRAPRGGGRASAPPLRLPPSRPWRTSSLAVTTFAAPPIPSHAPRPPHGIPPGLTPTVATRLTRLRVGVGTVGTRARGESSVDGSMGAGWGGSLLDVARADHRWPRAAQPPRAWTFGFGMHAPRWACICCLWLSRSLPSWMTVRVTQGRCTYISWGMAVRDARGS